MKFNQTSIDRHGYRRKKLLELRGIKKFIVARVSERSCIDESFTKYLTNNYFNVPLLVTAVNFT